MDIVYLDFGKPFVAVCRNTLLEKLLMYGTAEQTVRWAEKWCKKQAQRV